MTSTPVLASADPSGDLIDRDRRTFDAAVAAPVSPEGFEGVAVDLLTGPRGATSDQIDVSCSAAGRFGARGVVAADGRADGISFNVFHMFIRTHLGKPPVLPAA